MHFYPSPRMIEKAAGVARSKAIEGASLTTLGLTREGAVALHEAVHGRVVFPWDPDYPKARSGFNAGYEEYPQAIAYCVSPGDVRACLDWARGQGWKVACRSGGHSYANYSVNNGLVVDVSALNDVSVDPVAKTAKVGAGTSYEKLLAVLEWHGLNLPAAAAPTVAIAGYMMGGGYGFTSREYGMNCDCVLEATLMLADGSVVVASPTQHQELFWAIRGGTGNNFGVLLEVTFQLFDLTQVWGFRYQWSEDVAVDVLTKVQESYTKTADDRLGYLAGLVQQDSTSPPVVLMMGMFHGSREEGLKVLGELLAIGEPVTQVDRVGSYLVMNTMVMSVPYGIPTQPMPMPGFSSLSRVVTRPIAREAWEGVLAELKKTPSFGNYLCIEPYGGAINRRAGDFNAWSHRDGYMNVVSCAYWMTPGGGPDTRWLVEFMAPLEPFSDGKSYQNYPSRMDEDFAHRYWSEGTLERLSLTRKAYDPQELFRFQQSIPGPFGGAAKAG